MKRHRRHLAAAMVSLAGLVILVSIAHAQAPSAAASATAKTAPAASASTTASAPAKTAPAAGTPPRDLPPGHPRTPAGQGGLHSPGQGGIPDSVRYDKTLPPGVIDILIVDGDQKPIADAPIRLAIMFNSVTKGESRDQRDGKTNADGKATFKDLATGSGFSYRVSSLSGAAQFSSEPFGLTDKTGAKVLLHVYKPVSSLMEARLIMEAVIILEVKQDTVSVSNHLTVFNFGKNAYVAKDIRIPLPKGYKAFNSEESQFGQKMVERDGFLELVGTFGPGQARLGYRYQVPLGGGSELRLRIPLPPRVIATKVMVGANKKMTLDVAGFPAAKEGHWHDGKRVLETLKKPSNPQDAQAAMANLAPQILDVRITGLPAPGPKRLVALALAVIAMLGGAFYFGSNHQRSDLAPDERQDLREARDALLAEITLLERMRRSGEVGPHSYEQIRNQFLDALARIVIQLDPHGTGDEPSEPRKRKRKHKTSHRGKRRRPRA